MLNILYKLTLIALTVLFGLHIIAALVWGNWDQDGVGSLGFWVVFSETVVYYAWLYAALISTVVIFWLLQKGSR